jgi:8-oxo-dGTP diphosphatase
MSKVQEGATGAVIVNENNEILILQRSMDDDFLPGDWDIPGGGLDYGEEPEEGVKREVLEECGLEIEVGRPIKASTYYIGEIQRIDVSYLCKAKNPFNIKLSHEHSDFKWLKLEEMETFNLNPYIRKILLAAKEYLT